MLNEMPPNEWEGFKADVAAAFVGAIVVLIGLLFWINSNPGPLLVNEPCAPAHPVITNGEKVGCTNDAAGFNNWRPDWSPDQMP